MKSRIGDYSNVYSPEVLFTMLYKVLLIFELVDEIPKCGY